MKEELSQLLPYCRILNATKKVLQKCIIEHVIEPNSFPIHVLFAENKETIKTKHKQQQQQLVNNKFHFTTHQLQFNKLLLALFEEEICEFNFVESFLDTCNLEMFVNEKCLLKVVTEENGKNCLSLKEMKSLNSLNNCLEHKTYGCELNDVALKLNVCYLEILGVKSFATLEVKRKRYRLRNNHQVSLEVDHVVFPKGDDYYIMTLCWPGGESYKEITCGLTVDELLSRQLNQAILPARSAICEFLYRYKEEIYLKLIEQGHVKDLEYNECFLPQLFHRFGILAKEIVEYLRKEIDIEPEEEFYFSDRAEINYVIVDSEDYSIKHALMILVEREIEGVDISCYSTLFVECQHFKDGQLEDILKYAKLCLKKDIAL
ncbi:hypothetical protein ABK040_008711 [Willaertia magna]